MMMEVRPADSPLILEKDIAQIGKEKYVGGNNEVVRIGGVVESP